MKVFIATPRTEYVTRNVHEHRAPTDQSVALLREMEAAAEAKLVASVRLVSNEVRGVVHATRQFVDDSFLLIAIIDLNGKRLEIRHTAPGAEPPEESVTALRDAIAKRLANEILEPALRGILRVWRETS